MLLTSVNGLILYQTRDTQKLLVERTESLDLLLMNRTVAARLLNSFATRQVGIILVGGVPWLAHTMPYGIRIDRVLIKFLFLDWSELRMCL